MVISVGPPKILQGCLPSLCEVLRNPIVTLERISELQRDGQLLEPPPAGEGELAKDVWHTLRVYARQSALVNGRSLHTELTRSIREVGGAGATTILGEWGFSSDERPYGDRFGRVMSHAPTYTVYIDRPRKVAEAWPVVDDLTRAHGIVT